MRGWTAWAEHYLSCETCQLAPTGDLAHLDVFCAEGAELYASYQAAAYEAENELLERGRAV